MKDKLNKLIFLAVSMICNTRKTTPRLALEVMYDLPPLHLVVIQEALSAMARNRAVIINDWPGYNKKHRSLIGHVLYWENQSRQIGLRLEDTDALKADKWEKLYKVNLESFVHVGPPIHTQVNIYTDGSKTKEHVGSGYVIYHKGEELTNEIHTVRGGNHSISGGSFSNKTSRSSKYQNTRAEICKDLF